MHSEDVDPFRMKRQMDISNYSNKMKQADEDYLTNLVMEVRALDICLGFPSSVLAIVRTSLAKVFILFELRHCPCHSGVLTSVGDPDRVWIRNTGTY